METKHLIHLYNRAGFGILPQKLKQFSKKSIAQNVELIFKASETVQHLKVNTADLNTLPDKEESENSKRERIKKNTELIKELNKVWFQQLFNSQTVLRDQMCLFWTNHFVAADNNIIQTLQYHETIRNYALGNFKDFVLAISKTPLMIGYLNNKQNKKEHPNENFARELMELFTLGEGNYTEKDIQESARAFTGWFSKKNEFFFNKNQHDQGTKTFMGKTGNFNGEDIINIILEQKQCASFICTKLYKYFVNPIANEKHIGEMTELFYKDYHIGNLMKHIFMSKWFYDDQNIGVKIKSPVELLVGIHNVFPYQFEKSKTFEFLQFNLGQKLLSPPNVAGWPGDKQWIDANTIMLRLKLVSKLAQQNAIEMFEEIKFEEEFEYFNTKNQNKPVLLTAQIDWQLFEHEFANTSNQTIANILLNTPLSPSAQYILKESINQNPKDFCIEMMSLPEYQLC